MQKVAKAEMIAVKQLSASVSRRTGGSKEVAATGDCSSHFFVIWKIRFAAVLLGWLS